MARKPAVVLTDALKRKVLERISKGESLRSICQEKLMPDATQIHRLVLDDESFAKQYARAKQLQAEVYADELLSITDERKNDISGELGIPNGVAVQRDRLRVDTRKWLLSKVLPKVYGERLDLNHSGNVGVTLVHNIPRPDKPKS